MVAGALNSVNSEPSNLFFEDLRIGQKAGLMRTVMNGDLHLFAELSGDTNPLHICDRFAANTKFGQRIAHGMFTASLVSAIIGTRLPGPGAIYLSQTIRFLAPVRIGDVVTATVEVAELVPARHRVRLFCECVCDGRAVLEGEAWVVVDSRSPPPRSDVGPVRA
jgi:3-hydroxybutyryl-CoA dehydratase